LFIDNNDKWLIEVERGMDSTVSALTTRQQMAIIVQAMSRTAELEKRMFDDGLLSVKGVE